jgi:hypothetical protein
VCLTLSLSLPFLLSFFLSLFVFLSLLSFSHTLNFISFFYHLLGPPVYLFSPHSLHPLSFSPPSLLPSFPSSLHSTPRSPHTSRIKGPVLSGEERSETGIIRAGRGEQCGRTGGRICVFSSRVSTEVLLVAGIVSCLLLYFFFSFLFFFCLSVCFIVSFFVFSFFSFFLILP